MLSNKEIGKRIRKLRIERNLRQKDIADFVGVAESTIQRYETGKFEKIKLPIITAIAQALDVDPTWLIGKTEYNIKDSTSLVKENSTYYINEETRQIAQEIFENKDMRILFDVAKSAQAEDLLKYARYLKELQDKENN